MVLKVWRPEGADCFSQTPPLALTYLRLPGESSGDYSVVFLFCLFIHLTAEFMVCDPVLPDQHAIRVYHINDLEEDPRKITFFKV